MIGFLLMYQIAAYSYSEEILKSVEKYKDSKIKSVKIGLYYYSFSLHPFLMIIQYKGSLDIIKNIVLFIIMISMFVFSNIKHKEIIISNIKLFKTINMFTAFLYATTFGLLKYLGIDQHFKNLVFAPFASIAILSLSRFLIEYYDYKNSKRSII
jgi:hypothetical protein